MTIDLSDLRIKLNQMTEKIISGLKDRSRYSLNSGAYTEEFSDGLTWFEYRLKREQDIDSEFGRFEFSDQSPVNFSKEQLAKTKKPRQIPKFEVRIKNIDMSKEIIGIYKEILPKICESGEKKENFGETVKCDVNNVLLLNERINGLGRQVAESKIQENSHILDCKSDEDIKKLLVHPKREQEVINKAAEISKKYELNNEESIKLFFRKLIDLTVKVQIEYIKLIFSKTKLSKSFTN